ncbi:putative asparagine synthase [Mycena sp. CBHHK59/15]|nr:putative asparagine synthase [Mycena sp. CBHHK59/15]
MCGITVVCYSDAALRSSADNVTTLLNASLGNIGHRGPDSTGTYVSPDGRVGLGHARLAIIDLATGQQPLSDEEDLIHCVVTGEIYDHEKIRTNLETQGSIFKTKPDSELVVHLFGRLLIASEMKAFLPFGWKAEWDIDSVVQNGDFSDDRTVFKGVNKLMAGHSLLFRSTGYLKTQAYWDLNYAAPDAPNSSTIAEMISTVRSHLFEAIRLRLRSDVPIGVYLRGGIDSAAVAGIAMELLKQNDPNAKLATFTLAFRDARDHDEGPIASRTAAFIGAEEHMVEVTEVDLVNALEETMWHVEQPIFSFHGPGKFLLSKFVHNKGYKVVLSGEGADEFFGGYAWLPVDYLRQPDSAGLALGLDLPSDAERDAILNRIQLATVPVLSLSKNSYTDAHLARKMLGGVSTHRAYVAAGSAGAEVYNSTALAMTGAPDVTRAIAEGIDPRVREKAVSGKWHPLNVASYISAKTILQQVILNCMGERMEMAHSVEGRPAFLDHHLVEYINTLPPSVKVKPVKGDKPGSWSFTNKWILREAVKPYVTEELFLRRKLNYNAPPSRRDEGDLALVPLQAHLKSRITPANVERVVFFDWKFLEETLASYLAAPEFPADGSLDIRAQLLMNDLMYLLALPEPS